MKFDDLEATLKKRPDGAPSDLELDRLASGDLDPEQAAELQSRVVQFAETQERLAEIRKGLDAFPDVDERAQMAAIRRRLDEEQPSLVKRLMRGMMFLSPVVAVAAVTLLVMPRGGEGPATGTGRDEPLETVRLKGGLKLEVVRKRGERAEKVVSGSAFHAGDSLRFVISLPSAGQVNVVGVEAEGDLYVAWPLPDQDVATKRPAGDAQALPGAVELDDSKGEEMLYLVHCPEAVSPTCTSAGEGKPPRCQDGCALTPFLIRKE